jgi:GT2 family glycosyltransferase
MTRVSVVIPVYGNVALTLGCLDAIAAHVPKVDYEIIVVDDASPDRTSILLADRVARDNRLSVVTHTVNAGFGASCNDGADRAAGQYIVFLNNDTVPQPGWLDALVHHADTNPSVGIVGAKLLFPDGSVQHAGVVIGADRNPHHVYAGVPGDHPAVNKVRSLQIVTGACMLVRRELFNRLGGFDLGYRNGHEDVDLCLRAGRHGHVVHYCPDSVVTHLESVTRSLASAESAANGRRYRDQWAGVVEPDDLGMYADDGLLDIAYGDTYPVRVRISPLVARVDDGERRDDLERELGLRSAQVAELIRQVVGLTVDPLHAAAALPTADPASDDELMELLAELRDTLRRRRDGSARSSDGTTRAYRRLVRRVRETVVQCTSPAAAVAVISRGDDDLLDLDGRVGIHVPSTDDGRWLGHHPSDGTEALAYVNTAIARGATHLVIPTPSRWWSEQYASFASALGEHHTLVTSTDDCVVLELQRATRGTVEAHRQPTARATDDIETVAADAGRSDVDWRLDLHDALIVDLDDEVRALRALVAAISPDNSSSAGDSGDRIDTTITVDGPPTSLLVTSATAERTIVIEPEPELTRDAYAHLVWRVKNDIVSAIPAGATAAIVTRGDPELVDLADRVGWHFPRTDDGDYAGHHPVDSADAIDRLTAMRHAGATHLVIPATSSWWMTYYDGFRRHLQEQHRAVFNHGGTCLIFALEPSNPNIFVPESNAADRNEEPF